MIQRGWNHSKYQAMVTGNLQTPKQKFHCDNTTIPVSEDLTLLGVTIDNKLNFDKQIANVTRKVSQQLAVLKMFEKHSTAIYGKEFNHLLFPPPPHFDNFSDVWYFCSKTASDKLEKVNEGALHFVLKDKSSPYTELLLRRSTTYNLRGTDFLNSPKVNSTKHGLRSWRYLAPKMWNTLPETLKQESI